jgi:hypothetical protein
MRQATWTDGKRANAGFYRLDEVTTAGPGRPRKFGSEAQMKRWAKDRKRKHGQENQKIKKQAEAVGQGQSDASEDHENRPQH